MEDLNNQVSPSGPLPKPPNLSHLRSLTTPLGIVQHAIGEKPDFSHGYSIDDSARALIICVWYAELFGTKDIENLAPIYLKHIFDAQLKNGRFHNFKDKDGNFLDEEGSQDSFGRALWALGTASRATFIDYLAARESFNMAARHAPDLDYPRSIAFALLGAFELGDSNLVQILGVNLETLFTKNSHPDWAWFEPCIRYSNGILPYALLNKTNNRRLVAIGLKSLNFLNKVSRVNGIPSPIGNKGWYCYGKKRAVYDQQCIDAADMVLANAAAFEQTGRSSYRKEAMDWMRWFFGFNIKRHSMVTQRGGCFDGINADGINTHQGAESVIAYLLAYLTICRMGWTPNGYSSITKR